ncbi:hypothetical protein DV736_g1154, partial [Chaetothyriales sp. CBS 134916]
MSPKHASTTLLTSLTRSSPSAALSSSVCSSCALRLRTRHASSTTHLRPIPPPTPFVPDVSTFLRLIGRSLSSHTDKISSWNDLFTSSSQQLKKRGLEPARSRRYLLRWREKFRHGDYGIGGDLKYVDEEGVAELRVCEVPQLPRANQSEGGLPATLKTMCHLSTTPGMQKVILNVPKGSHTYVLEEGQSTADLKKPKGFKLVDNAKIVGSYVQPVKGSGGSVATFRVTDGMWEDKLGMKVHGGERRRKEVLHKLRVEEGRKARR